MTYMRKARHNGHGAEHIVRGAYDEARRRAIDAGEDLKSEGFKLVDRVTAKGEKWLEDAKKRGAGAVEGVRDWASENPEKAAGTAFALGAILALWFTRGRGED